MYIYETHLHTSEASQCGKTPGAEYIGYMQGLGYSGIIVTDHFFNGNSCVDRALPWEERVRIYCSGYEHALEAAQGTDFKVFFGVEFNFEGDEYLLYGLDKEWLLAHPEVMEMTRPELHRAMRDLGGMMIQAHPYRERGYLTAIHLLPGDVDGAESYNAANEPYQNALGYRYARDHGLIMTGGSDIHFFHDGDMGGMAFDYPLKDIRDYIRGVLSGEGTPVVLRGKEVIPSAEVPEFTETDRGPSLPVIWH